MIAITVEMLLAMVVQKRDDAKWLVKGLCESDPNFSYHIRLYWINDEGIKNFKANSMMMIQTQKLLNMSSKCSDLSHPLF